MSTSNNSLNVNSTTPLRPSYGGTGFATAGAPARYVVSTVAGQAGFTTIQAAITQAVTDGASAGTQATVWIYPGTYVEDLTLADYVNLAAASGPSNGVVNIVGNSVYAGSGALVLTGIGFTAAGVTAAVSFQSASQVRCVLQSVALNASSGIGIECTSATTTLIAYNCTLQSGEGGRCFNVTNGFVELVSNITAFTDTASTISGGTVRCISCDFEDSFAVSGGAIQILNCIIISNTFQCISLSRGGSAIVVDATMSNTATPAYVVGGVGVLTYSGIVCIQEIDSKNVPLDPGLTLLGLPTLAGVIQPSSPLAANYGGTGVANNVASTQTITGAYSLGWTLTGATSLTLPTSGTLATVSSSGGLTPVSVSGTSQALVSGSVYMFNNAAATTGTLPLSGSSAIGDVIKIKGRSAAPWVIQANTGQVITDGSVASSTAGTATSAAGTDSIQFTYVAANEWSVDWQLSSSITLA